MPAACAESVPVPGHEPSLLPSGREFRLVWNDEFDGAFEVDYVRVFDEDDEACSSPKAPCSKGNL